MISQNTLQAALPKLAVLTALTFSTALLPTSAVAFDDSEKAEIGEIVRQYLLDNPELIVEVQEALEARQVAETAEQQKAVLASASDDIFNNAADPVFGDPNGDVTIVEFFDYNCGFCRRSLPDMEYILENDTKVKFVLKEFPIFGPNSVAVHTVALAFHKIAPEKYLDFHIAMMGEEGQIDETRALTLAEASGVDMDALRDEMNNPEIVASFRETDTLASGLGITGTPSYVVGNELVVGALGKDVLLEKIQNMRTCASTVC